MAPTLADSLDVMLPTVPRALVPLDLHPHLRDLAERLAPIPRCGFEVRLGASSEVDFQQGIEAHDDERQSLLAHLRGAGDNRPAWRALEQFLVRWSDPGSPLHRGVEDIWLEFDRPPGSALSVFMGFPAPPRDRTDHLEVARAGLDVLGAGWGPTLQRCFEACPNGTFVKHLGVMLGRSVPFVRVNVARLKSGDVAGYLERVGWPGEVSEVDELMARLSRGADNVAVCLDVGEEVQVPLGFECSLNRQPPTEPRWAGLLDELVSCGWCAPEKRDALLEWPGVTVPEDQGEGWPAHLVQAALRRPPDHFTSLERLVSHVKVAYAPGQPVEAKGYFGFLHAWQRPAMPTEPARPNGRRRRTATGETGAVESAIAFLLAARDGAGWWRDFYGATDEWRGTFGCSDEWVTAFVGTALAEASNGQEAARQAWALLAQRRDREGGWGYNRLAGVDADSTTWGLRLASALGDGDSPVARRAWPILQDHVLPGGGVATYRDKTCPRPRAATLRPPDGSYAGWCDTGHACVTAAAASVAGDGPRDFLRRAQRDDGSWGAYWWADDEYATALAAEALDATGREDDRLRVESAVRWALGRDGDAASPFATAWRVRILRLAGEEADVDDLLSQSLRRLRDVQEADGGWPASARMLAPRPDLTERPDRGGPMAATCDDARIFTTATVLSALAGGGA